MRKAILTLVGLVALLGGMGLLTGYLGGALGVTGERIAQSATVTPLRQSPAPTTFCPPATPEPLWVEPVDSPTCCFTQVITVTIGNGEYVSVTAESGSFEISGTFSVNDPATVSIRLLQGTTHHLRVAGRVRVIQHDGCTYGGYTLYTDHDRLGQPLVIVQGEGCHTFYLPLVLKAAQ